MATPSNDNLYAPPKSTVADLAVEAGAKASRGSRLAAVIIDSLIFTIPFVPSYSIAWRSLMQNVAASGGKSNPFAIYGVIGSTGVWFYVGALAALVTFTITAVLVYRNGQTIGKKLLGIKVVRTDGSKAGIGRIFWLRNVVNTIIILIPLVGTLYSLIDSLCIFGEAKRCLHDRIADTIVVQA